MWYLFIDAFLIILLHLIVSGRNAVIFLCPKVLGTVT